MSMTTDEVYKREYFAHFIDVNFGTSPLYKRLGHELESAYVNTGINTESKKNIIGEMSFRITEYAPTFEVNSYFVKEGDPLWEKLWENFKKRKTADAYETTVVDVLLYSDGTIKEAQKTKVRVMPTSFGGEGMAELESPFTINYTGIPEELTVSNLSIANNVLTISSGSGGSGGSGG